MINALGYPQADFVLERGRLKEALLVCAITQHPNNTDSKSIINTQIYQYWTDAHHDALLKILLKKYLKHTHLAVL